MKNQIIIAKTETETISLLNETLEYLDHVCEIIDTQTPLDSAL